MVALVFVYGTLKRGFPNHPLLSRASFRGRARTLQTWPLVIAGEWYVPCLLRREGSGHRVRGELYAVDAGTLAALDALEGVDRPDGYERAPIALELEADATRLEALVYFKREPLGALHSDWLEDYQDSRYVEPEARA